MMKWVVPLQPVEVHSSAEIHLQPMDDPMLEQVNVTEGGYSQSRLHAGPHRASSPRWSSLFLKDCTLWKGPTLEQLVKNCSLCEGSMLEKCVEDHLLWEDPALEQEKSGRRKE
ncbi:hypothetical protein AV530_012319 [Patagioenas fasciata monilis]|uniref:Uncharacterized protein n=1 Tax=Patagioenas fasciata monilis TaxID=372326 RepID=A0A1V4JAC3_PATFA|nr:hypothetical protein AV530_012319 [Patagioenas fasciata monilis]